VIDYQLRPVEPSDSAALYNLHRATMGTYIEDVYGTWNEDVQQAFHEAWMQHKRAQVVEVSGHLVGVVDIEWREDDLHLARIEISPKLQNLGLGPRSSRDSSTWPRADSVPLPWTSSTSTRLGIYTSVLALNRSVSADGRSTCGALIAE